MKSINYIVKIHPAIEGGFWAEVPTLPGCFTQGDSVEAVTAKIREAMECHLASMMREGLPLPVEERDRRGFAIPVLVSLPQLS